MRDKGQVFIFNDAELRLIKQTFADNEILLYAVRKVLLQFPLTPAEKEYVKQAMTPEVFAVIKKRIYPDLDPDAPLGQLADYRTLLTQDLKSKSTQDLGPIFDARRIEMAYLDQQFRELQDVHKEHLRGVSLEKLRSLEGKDELEQHVDLMAYLNILGYVDPMLLYLQQIAGEKEETTEQQKERMKRNSSK